MFVQMFSAYLVEQGILTNEQREQILDKTSVARARLGTIAIADKLITEEQANELNQLQTQMDKRFGDLAIEKGYLTSDEVEVLLRKQQNPYALFVQLAEEIAGIGVSKIETDLEIFKKSKGYSDKEMDALKNDEIDSLLTVIAPVSVPYVTDMVGLAIRSIVRLISSDFYVGNIKKANQLSFQQMGCQFLKGEHNIYVGFSCDSDRELRSIAQVYAKHHFDDSTEGIFDAVGEFINCLNGLFATELSNREIEVDMEPPVCYVDGEITGAFYELPIYIRSGVVHFIIAADTEVAVSCDPYVLEKHVEVCGDKAEGSKASILIVDDSKLSRKVLRAVLEKEGYYIAGEAVDGVDAVEAFKKCKPDIVTLDVTMPNMDGIEALKQIMAIDKNAKVVMITAAGQQKRIIEALKIGAKKFITKPFDAEDIVKNFNFL